MADQHRHCKCGAVYRRTEAMAATRELSSFECFVCGDTIETWNSGADLSPDRGPCSAAFRLLASPLLGTEKQLGER